MPARIIVLLVALGVVLAGITISPDLLLQVFIRGGLVIGGIAITLALRPHDEDPAVAVPVARVIGH